MDLKLQLLQKKNGQKTYIDSVEVRFVKRYANIARAQC